MKLVTSRSLLGLISAFICLVALNSVVLGQTQFQRTYGGTGSEVGNSAQQTFDGHIIVGSTRSFGLSVSHLSHKNKFLWRHALDKEIRRRHL